MAAPPPLETATQPAAKPLPKRMSRPSLPAVEAAPEPPPKGRVLAVVLNVSIAFVLLVVVASAGAVLLNEGKLDRSALDPKKLAALFFTRPDLVAVDLSNGLYDTKNGRPVFYVRGDVKNRGGATVRARVRAEILEGDALVRAGEAWAGEPPTPADLGAVVVSDDVQKLNAREDGARDLAPGEAAPFVISFYEYPSDLRAFRVRVTVSSAGRADTAAAR